jgi:hypothetical protein
MSSANHKTTDNRHPRAGTNGQTPAIAAEVLEPARLADQARAWLERLLDDGDTATGTAAPGNREEVGDDA